MSFILPWPNPGFNQKYPHCHFLSSQPNYVSMALLYLSSAVTFLLQYTAYVRVVIDLTWIYWLADRPALFGSRTTSTVKYCMEQYGMPIMTVSLYKVLLCFYHVCHVISNNALSMYVVVKSNCVVLHICVTTVQWCRIFSNSTNSLLTCLLCCGNSCELEYTGSTDSGVCQEEGLVGSLMTGRKWWAAQFRCASESRHIISVEMSGRTYSGLHTARHHTSIAHSTETSTYADMLIATCSCHLQLNLAWDWQWAVTWRSCVVVLPHGP